jgi:hypothetical protein
LHENLLPKLQYGDEIFVAECLMPVVI